MVSCGGRPLSSKMLPPATDFKWVLVIKALFRIVSENMVRKMIRLRAPHISSATSSRSEWLRYWYDEICQGSSYQLYSWKTSWCTVYIILFRICFKLWPCFHRTMTEKLSNHVGAAFWHTIYQWDRHWYWRVGFPTKKVNFPFFTIIILHIPDQWSNIKASKFGEFLRSTSFFNQVVSAGVAQLRN